MYCYVTNDVKTKSDFTFDPMKFKALDQYSTHYGNYLYLSFMLNHPDTSFSEKHQVGLEMIICERKLTYWRKWCKLQKYTENQVATEN